MTTIHSPLVIGVYGNEADAKNAVDALKAAGFDPTQIGFALREGGIVTKSLMQDLLKLGVPQEEASYYDSEYNAGHAIVSVRPDGREREARDILHQSGAYEYGARSDSATEQPNTTWNRPDDRSNYTEATTYDQASQPDNAPAYDTNTYDNEQRHAFKVREEQLQADKERVQSGEVRLHKDVVTEQRQIDVPVTHEEVYVEHRPYEQGQPTDAEVGEDETIRVPVTEEQVNVTKQPVETGEVQIGKRTVEEQKHFTDTVRREKPRLEQEGNPPVNTNNDIEES